jgi:hypothetical protein
MKPYSISFIEYFYFFEANFITLFHRYVKVLGLSPFGHRKAKFKFEHFRLFDIPKIN